ncbi:MAG: cytochrome P450 [Spongiibacter sp.]|uniref:cytochrome P450 n=1 Tax=Spongiibacter TaxID=630749 RepID=UPI001B01F3BA|nr:MULTISPECIES: cytochrome P450 [Spongiibacter]MBO6753037.1 cytochrome P450 [Spongiibacter sp.]|tara:strand:- start:45095 stop:46333 length:1239 start_codon:yes stop_codon:yes gene_type:complete
MAIANLDILSDAFSYQRPADIDAKLAELRATDGIAYVEPEGIRPYWAVSRYEDIRYIESHPELFSAEPRTVLIMEALEQTNIARFGDAQGVKTLVHMDGEQHRALRQITRDWFMPANVAKLRGHVNELASEFVQRLRDTGGDCDFAADIAFWYPLRVILQLIGLPQEDEATILALTQRLFAPDGYVTEEQDATAVFVETVQRMGEYFTALAEDRRASPRDDLASLLANAKLDDQLLDPFTLTSYFVLLATAGHDTTSASIAGGMLALIEHPDQRTLLEQHPELLPQAADEMIRWVTPVKHFARTALEDVELRGQRIRKGETLAMFFASANRDEEAIADAGRFDIQRKGSRHLAFGHGRHNCLGMHLARMEIECFFGQLLPQLDSVALAGTPTYIPSQFVSGLQTLPLTMRFR